jgi:hypothetical protein
MIVLENDKGEIREVQSGQTWTAPWKPKGTVANMRREQAKNEATAHFATLASEWGLPTSVVASVARWLLAKNCPYCDIAGEFLALLESGKIEKSQARILVLRALNAKDQNDREELSQLKGELLRLSK